MTIQQQNQLNQYGQTNTPNEFANLQNYATATWQQKTMNIQNFENDDKISLYQNQSGLFNSGIVNHSDYTVDNSNLNNPKIYRKVCQVNSQGSAQSPTSNTYCKENSSLTSTVITNHVSISVSGGGNLFNGRTVNDLIQSGIITLRNN